MIRIEYFLKKSNVISYPIIEKHGVIQRNVTIQNSILKIEAISQSSYLHEEYENLFLNPLFTKDQSVLLPAGSYVVSCDNGYITIPFHGEADSEIPFNLNLDSEEEIFFQFSSDCEKPLLVESVFNHPFTIDVKNENYLEFDASLWEEQRKQDSIIHQPNSGSYQFEDQESIYVEDSVSFIGWHDSYLGAVQVKLGYQSERKPGLTTSYYFIDDNNIYINETEEEAIGVYEDLIYQIILSFYKNSSNYLAIRINPNYSLELIGKISGVDISEDLGVLLNNKDILSFFFAENTIYITIQNTNYIFSYEDLFEFSTLYIGYDGINTYLNNSVIGVKV
jgi:hypothetical protein